MRSLHSGLGFRTAVTLGANALSCWVSRAEAVVFADRWRGWLGTSGPAAEQVHPHACGCLGEKAPEGSRKFLLVSLSVSPLGSIPGPERACTHLCTRTHTRVRGVCSVRTRVWLRLWDRRAVGREGAGAAGAGEPGWLSGGAGLALGISGALAATYSLASSSTVPLGAEVIRDSE